jgi:heme oxygenase (biliverdin-IX-beta and delta-forming)
VRSAERTLAVLPRHPVLACRRAEDAWGLLYLLEGSSLGGQLIARHLAATLGLTAANGAAGMAPYGAETGTLWRSFKRELDLAAMRPGFDPDAVIDAANAGFGRLDAWMAGAW